MKKLSNQKGTFYRSDINSYDTSDLEFAPRDCRYKSKRRPSVHDWDDEDYPLQAIATDSMGFVTEIPVIIELK